MQVLVHVSTYQGKPFWYWFSEPQPLLSQKLAGTLPRSIGPSPR